MFVPFISFLSFSPFSFPPSVEGWGGGVDKMQNKTEFSRASAGASGKCRGFGLAELGNKAGAGTWA